MYKLNLRNWSKIYQKRIII